MKVTDEMVLAALNAHQRTDHAQCGIKRAFVESISLADWAEDNVEKMREAVSAALSRAATPEEEWEYTWKAFGVPQLALGENYPTAPRQDSAFRRRKAGPWEPLPVGGGDAAL